MKITCIAAPHRPHPVYKSDVSQRVLYRIDRFAQALGEQLDITIPVAETDNPSCATDEYLLVFDTLVLQREPALGRRAIVVNIDRSEEFEQPEHYNVVAAIEKHRYFLWTAEPEAERGDGLIGRRSVAERLGATVWYPEHLSGLYVRMALSTAPDLVHLLARYLMAIDDAG